MKPLIFPGTTETEVRVHVQQSSHKRNSKSQQNKEIQWRIEYFSYTVQSLCNFAYNQKLTQDGVAPEALQHCWQFIPSSRVHWQSFLHFVINMISFMVMIFDEHKQTNTCIHMGRMRRGAGRSGKPRLHDPFKIKLQYVWAQKLNKTQHGIWKHTTASVCKRLKLSNLSFMFIKQSSRWSVMSILIVEEH